MSRRGGAGVVDRGPARTGGFTLVELVLAMGIMALLFVGMASALSVALRTLPDPTAPRARAAEGLATLETIAADLALATRITERGTRSITIVVPDRGHGAAGDETIRYAWSGTPGDPLTRSYNGAGAITIQADVHDFRLAGEKRIAELDRMPRVLLVTNDPPGSAVPDKVNLMTSWGFEVTQIRTSASSSAMSAALLQCDVVYTTRETGGLLASLLSLLGGDGGRSWPVGHVVETPSAYENVGFSALSTTLTLSGTTISISSLGHPITEPYWLGSFVVTDSAQALVECAGATAPDGVVLATRSGNAALMAIEFDGRLYDGATSGGRRVKLPWGKSTGFDFNELSADGQALLRRSLVWAAQPLVWSAAEISLQVGSDAAAAAQTRVRLVNEPPVNDG